MGTSKLRPNDPRLAWSTTVSRGHTYSYGVLDPPTSPAKDTIVLLHGFPDLSFGWRYQAPFLASLGYRVVIPDMLGYGRTDAPSDPAEYTLKKLADDIAAIARAAAVPEAGGDNRVILGGHDWGGEAVWRTCLHRPEIVKATFVICTPYKPPSTGPFRSLQELMERGKLSNLRYQLQLRGPDVEQAVTSTDGLLSFHKTMFGGRTPKKTEAFDPVRGLHLDEFMTVGQSPLVSDEEMEYIVAQYALRGNGEEGVRPLGGPLNWYRTQEMNFADEVPLAKAGRTKIDVPTLFIVAKHDVALVPKMSEGMEQNFSLAMRRVTVDAGHWALIQAPKQVNQVVGEFLATLEKKDAKL